MASHPTVNFRHVQYARHKYVNQHGMVSNLLPRDYTYFGCPIDKDEWLFNTCRTIKLRDKIIAEKKYDIWTPITTLVFNNRKLVFTGDKAKQMWDAWNEYIFNTK